MAGDENLSDTTSFDAALLLSLQEKVETASWDPAIVGPDYHSPDGLELLDALYGLVEAMPADARPLTLELIQHLCIVYNYRPHAVEIATHIRTIASSLKTGRVIILPVKEPNDPTNNSGNSLVYEIESILNKYVINNIAQYDTPFSQDISVTANDVVYFVDDFVGSGNQYKKMWLSFSSKHGTAFSVIFRSIVSMRKGLKKIADFGHLGASHFVLDPCISSGLYITTMDKDAARKTYDAAEGTLSIRPFYKSGYNKSQSLAVMKKTPNNTLPIFWAMKMKGGKKWPSPFPEKR